MGVGRRSGGVRVGAVLAAGTLAAVAGCSSGSTSNAVQTPSAVASVKASGTTAGSASAAPSGTAAQPVVTSVASPSPWTQQRLAKAVSNHGGDTKTANSNVITARVGAIFANSSSGDHFCTGSVVQSKGRSIVLTAAHCVDGGRNGGGPNTDIVFVPGYRNGEKPQGQWPVKSVIVDQRWEDNSDPDYDVAFLVLGTVNNQPIASVLGGNKLGVNLGFGRTVVLTGYPSNQGEPIACFNTTTQQSAKQMKIACKSFPGGTSGSPWLTAFDRTTRTGTVIGVIGGYQEGGDTDDISYSPYFDNDILSLYNQAVAQGG